jgi:hypothetical protein
LLREYTSMRVLAVYAGGASDSILTDVLARADQEAGSSSESGLPASVPASLLAEQPRPAIVGLSAIAGQSSGDAAVIDEPVPATSEELPGQPVVDGQQVGQGEWPVEDRVDAPVQQDQPALRNGGQATALRNTDTVMLLPWHGPFAWNGLIVTAAYPGIGLELMEPCRVPLERLTDRLAVALEFEQTDALSEEHDRRAARTAEF